MRWKEMARSIFSRNKLKNRQCEKVDSANVCVQKEIKLESSKSSKELSLMELLALRSLELAAPASDIALKGKLLSLK